KADIEGKLDTAVGELNTKNGAQDGLITSNTQTITQNKAEQALADAAQDAALQAEADRLDAANAATNDVVAANKADADSKIDATNQTIQNNL
ncbi:hypothetical protein ACTXIV_14630, partial [Psychrobacter celer]|uniref:hypothetical protein n=1 Tax=Psychrobacter celer TaxID=306572 RepID=UPI003FD061E3